MMARAVTIVALIVAAVFGLAALVVAFRLDSLEGIISQALQVKILAYALMAAGLCCLYATIRNRIEFLEVILGIAAVAAGALGAVLLYAPWRFIGNVGHDVAHVIIAIGLAAGAFACATISYRAYDAR
jgi:hypothetical protein